MSHRLGAGGPERSGPSPARRRFGLAASALTLIAAIALPPGANAAPAALLPDLVPLALEPPGGADATTIELYLDDGRPILDVGFTVANIGRGPLEVLPLDESAGQDCDGDGTEDRKLQQNIYLDGDGSGAFDPAVDRDVAVHKDGCAAFHPGHGHWHTVGITTELTAESTGAPAPGLDKYAFCLIDADIFDETLPGFSDLRVYPSGGCGEADPQGISIGWYDVYWVGLPGQQVDLTGVAAGVYCLRQTVDGGDFVDELSDANNARELRISLDPASADLDLLPGRCAGPDPGVPPVVDETPPETTFTSEPGATVRTSRRRARLGFAFASSEPGSSFACRADGRGFSPCSPGVEARLRARRGRGAAHSFEVRAIDAAGNADATPARWSGRVKRRPAVER